MSGFMHNETNTSICALYRCCLRLLENRKRDVYSTRIFSRKSCDLSNNATFHCRIVSWFMTYTRIFGRGYTLDDPDMISCVAMVANAIIYLIYNIQLIVSPEHYETNMLYKYADIIGFVDTCFCVFACLRDDDWFWFLPLAGQYGIALGRVQVETKTLPQFGKTPILLTSMCRRRTNTIRSQKYCEINMHNDIITVPIFAPPLQRSITTHL